jgi:hypothetical protein
VPSNGTDGQVLTKGTGTNYGWQTATVNTDSTTILFQDSILIYYALGIEYDRDTIRIPSSGGGISGSGTTNYVSKWTGATSQGNSIIQDNGSEIGIGLTPVTNTRFAIQGQGSTSANPIALFENSLGADVLQVDGLDGIIINGALKIRNGGGKVSTNTAIGVDALNVNTTGSDNVALGRMSMFRNTSGRKNMAVGPFTMEFNLTGESNVAIGNAAMYRNVSGNFNVAIGDFALGEAMGDANTGIGKFAGSFIVSGGANTGASNSTFIGGETKAGAINQTNQTVVGFGAEGKGSNTATIGNSSVTVLYLAGAVGWFQGTGSPEGVVTAPVGSFYSNKSGGAGTTFYVKESGTGNVGWIGK